METLESLASLSSERAALLEFLLSSQGKVSVRNTAALLKISPALVSRLVSKMEKGGLVKNGQLDFLNPLVRALKILFNIQKLESSGVVSRLRKTPGFLGCGLYGSWANGTNALESDCDLWLKASKPLSMPDRGELESEFSEKLGVRCSVLALAPAVLGELKKRDFVFYCALSNSFVLAGEGI